MLQLEGWTTEIYNYVLEGFGEKKQKKRDWQQLLAQVPILKKKKKPALRKFLKKKKRLAHPGSKPVKPCATKVERANLTTRPWGWPQPVRIQGEIYEQPQKKSTN